MAQHSGPGLRARLSRSVSESAPLTSHVTLGLDSNPGLSVSKAPALSTESHAFQSGSGRRECGMIYPLSEEIRKAQFAQIETQETRQ